MRHLARSLAGVVLDAYFSDSRKRRAERELREEIRINETLQRIGAALAAELDLDKLVQKLTDEATALTDAQFGAFFYAAQNEAGQTLTLYTFSGAARETFERVPLPHSTSLFGPTLRGERTVRLDDVHADPRYGKDPPYHGLPEGHPPIRSYLAVPVVSRCGKPLGALFFGHAEPGVFTERDERLVAGIAGQAAAAIDNARLYRASQDARRQAEEAHRQAEEARAQAEEARGQAEKANRLKDEFLSLVSHELRTPITAIMGWTQVLATRECNAETRARALAAIDRNVRAQMRIIDDLLDVSRIITGKLGLSQRLTDLGDVVRAVIDVVRPAARAKGIELHVTPENPAIPVFGDPDRLRQILWNLLANAIKFTPRGGRVEVEIKRDEGLVYIIVRDTGKGISAAFLPYVFDRFRQADSSASRPQGGLGLGLAIVRHLVEMHGGTVTAESAGSDHGATFTVTLPLPAEARDTCHDGESKTGDYRSEGSPRYAAAVEHVPRRT
ncbi:GAF domain-containing sensor histidine kinase [Polyangium sp. y55x31]|uniref:GAF domain-containing sensor histidine kinase n=1 Tax=Polyangium sp. y55x31 TaxID=3042688 RepID=UPI0024832976|nr:GAF domain-containing sensor histidine kinase [Polyangium sp. y55x31]MDI1475123.1 GAF domain-containing sensor histidine kinase [Polyangium sp. y55x31]